MKQSEGFTSKQRNYKRLLKEGETVTRSTDWEGNCYFDNWFFYECSYIITNTPVFDLLHTGATGTWKYGFVGLGIALAAGVGTTGTVVTKRRRRKKQDK